jgi:hypothetical protein
MRPETPVYEARKPDRNGVAVPQLSAAPEWPTLLGRMLDDLTRVLQLELQLAENRIGTSLAAVAGRIVAALVALFAAVFGAVCFIAALILLLHEWMEWWESLAVGGAVILSAGLIAYAALAKRPVPSKTAPSASLRT